MLRVANTSRQSPSKCCEHGGRQTGKNKIVTKSNDIPKTVDSIPVPVPGWVVRGHGGCRASRYPLINGWSTMGHQRRRALRAHSAMPSAMNGWAADVESCIKRRGRLFHVISRHYHSHQPGLTPSPVLSISSIFFRSFAWSKTCPDNGNQLLVSDAWLSRGGFEPHLADRTKQAI